MSFAVDSGLCLLVLSSAVLFFFLWRWRRSFLEPSFYFSDITIFSSRGLRTRAAALPMILIWMALIAFSLAFIDPRVFIDRQGTNAMADQMPIEGIAIYLVLDQSGSMKEKVVVELPSGQLETISKIDLLKKVSKQFIEGDKSLGLKGRSNDMLGLVYFARAAQVMAPLTLDHRTILEELNKFDAVKNRSEDGTSIGYAIYKTANMIASTKHFAQELIERGEPAYTIKSSVIILITDGLQDPNPLDKGKRLRNMDVPEAAEYAKEQGVRLYIVNVEPKLGTEEFAPYRHIMQRAAEATGGKFFMVDNASSLQKIYREIDQLERSALPEMDQLGQKDKRPDLYSRVSFYPYLVAIGLFCLFVSILLQATLLRRVP